MVWHMEVDSFTQGPLCCSLLIFFILHQELVARTEKQEQELRRRQKTGMNGCCRLVCQTEVLLPITDPSHRSLPPGAAILRFLLLMVRSFVRSSAGGF